MLEMVLDLVDREIQKNDTENNDDCDRSNDPFSITVESDHEYEPRAKKPLTSLHGLFNKKPISTENKLSHVGVFLKQYFSTELNLLDSNPLVYWESSMADEKLKNIV